MHYVLYYTFQSTPSLRKVTAVIQDSANIVVISIHTFLTEGDVLYRFPLCVSMISIHTFLTEGDECNVAVTSCNTEFQSTPSLRKVTLSWALESMLTVISIHTFLTEGD